MHPITTTHYQPIPQGPEPIGQPRTVSQPQPATSGPVQTQHQPHDVAQTQVAVSFGGQVTSGMQTMQAASPAQTQAFFRSHAGKPAAAVQRAGDNFVIRVGGEHLMASRNQLEQAFRSGQLDGESPLARSLFVAELAANANLPAQAQRAILSGFQTACQMGKPTFAAMREAQFNIILATEVEGYIRSSEGLAKDMKRIGSFTQDAKAGAMDWINSLKSRERSKQIKASQAQLNETLNTFTASLGRAQETGDYAQAFDALQTFFQRSANQSHDPYWQQRLETRSQAIADTQTTRSEPVSGLMQAAIDGGRDTARQATDGPQAKDLLQGFAELERDVGPHGVHPVNHEPLVRTAERSNGVEVEVHRKLWAVDHDHNPVKYDGPNYNFYTQYLTADNRNVFEVIAQKLQDGDASGQDNVRLVTPRSLAGSGQDGRMDPEQIFALGQDGKLYSANQFAETIYTEDNAPAHLHHASFMSGDAVLGAGEIHTDETGAVKAINNKSGHYRPGAAQTSQTIQHLESLGVNMTNVRLEQLGPGGNIQGMATEFMQGGRTGAERLERFQQRHTLADDLNKLNNRDAYQPVLNELRLHLPANWEQLDIPAKKAEIQAVFDSWAKDGVNLGKPARLNLIQRALDGEMPPLAPAAPALQVQTPYTGPFAVGPAQIAEIRNDSNVQHALAYMAWHLPADFEQQPADVQRQMLDDFFRNTPGASMPAVRMLLTQMALNGELPQSERLQALMSQQNQTASPAPDANPSADVAATTTAATRPAEFYANEPVSETQTVVDATQPPPPPARQAPPRSTYTTRQYPTAPTASQEQPTLAATPQPQPAANEAPPPPTVTSPTTMYRGAQAKEPS